jgi:hypothetical protein
MVADPRGTEPEPEPQQKVGFTLNDPCLLRFPANKKELFIIFRSLLTAYFLRKSYISFETVGR